MTVNTLPVTFPQNHAAHGLHSVAQGMQVFLFLIMSSNPKAQNPPISFLTSI